MSPAERSAQLGRFLHGAASVLLATDVAGQGLNLQDRARWVISLELPWNPARLEQRVGRVDRIGQHRRVHFTLLIARGDAESGLLARVARRVLSARNALGGSTLRAAAPADADLRRALIEGGSAEPVARPAPVIALCRRWSRPARVVAARLQRSRDLTAHWRGPAPARPAWSVARRQSIEHLFVFSVPLVAGNGDVVERHVVAIRVPAVGGKTGYEAAVDPARQIAARHLTPRAARLTRLRMSLLSCEAAVDAALIEELSSSAPRELQPGLFDRAAARAFDAAHEEDTAIVDAIRDRQDRRTTAAAVVVGRPALAIAFIAP
jgi:hypothetical protein